MKNAKKKKSILWDRLAKKYCALCKKDILYDECNLDHIIPIKLGGRNSLINLQLVHSYCNSKKGHSVLEFSSLRKKQFTKNAFEAGYFDFLSAAMDNNRETQE